MPVAAAAGVASVVMVTAATGSSGICTATSVDHDTSCIVFPQQHVGLWVPGQSAGAPFVTVTSQPQFGSGQR